MSTAPEAPAAVLARGLARRMAQVRKAEEQLAAFAWKEGATEDDGSTGPGGSDEATPWVLRVLRAASEGDSHRALRVIAREGQTTVAALSRALDCGRTDAADRVSALAQAGLVARDLESDRIGLTELGRGVLALVDEVAGLVTDGPSGSGEGA